MHTGSGAARHNTARCRTYGVGSGVKEPKQLVTHAVLPGASGAVELATQSPN